MPRRTMTIEEAKAWLAANKDRIREFDDIEDMPPDLKESRLLGSGSDLSWRRLLRELQESSKEDEKDGDE